MLAAYLALSQPCVLPTDVAAGRGRCLCCCAPGFHAASRYLQRALIHPSSEMQIFQSPLHFEALSESLGFNFSLVQVR